MKTTSNTDASHERTPHVSETASEPSAEMTRRTLISSAVLASAAILSAPAAAFAQNPPAPATGVERANGRFAGKVVLITGATSGIGEGTARAFAREGAKVFFNGRRKELGQKVEAEIRAAGGNATFHQSDVRDETQVKAFVAACIAAHGRVDIAFNNAGIARPENARIHQTSEATFRDVIDTNTIGVFFCMKHEIAQMLVQGSGAIINTCSMAGFKAGPTAGPYISSKHALLGLTRAGAVEYAKDNIRITSIAPGYVDTPMLHEIQERRDKATFAEMVAGAPLGRAQTPEDMARVVMFLASDDATALHGSNVDVSAGFLD